MDFWDGWRFVIVIFSLPKGRIKVALVRMIYQKVERKMFMVFDGYDQSNTRRNCLPNDDGEDVYDIYYIGSKQHS